MRRGCSHAYGMIFDGDYCCCKICEAEWHLTPRGWVLTDQPEPKSRYNNDSQRMRRYKGRR